MRAQRSFGNIRWTFGIVFLILGMASLGQAAVPARVTLLAPAASLSDTTPTYTWKAVAGATSYQLWVKDSTGTRLKRWYAAAAVQCANGTGTCMATPRTVLDTGATRWQVRARHEQDTGAWSRALQFTVIPLNGTWRNVLQRGDRYDYITDLALGEPLFTEIWSVLHESNAPCWISQNSTLTQYQFYVDGSFMPGPLYRYNGIDVSVGRIVVHDLGWYFGPGNPTAFPTIHIDAAFEDIYLIIVDAQNMFEVFQHFNGAVVITPFQASRNNCL